MISPASPNSWTANATSPADDEDQDDAGDGEEAPQVDPDAGPEDRPADTGGDQQARERGDEGLNDGSARRPDGVQEQDRLEPFARDRDEGETGQRDDRAAGQGDIHAVLELPFIARPWRRIQNSIQVRTTTAMRPARPSMLSWTMSGRRPTVATIARPTTTERVIAAPTPTHTPRSASRRSSLTR